MFFFIYTYTHTHTHTHTYTHTCLYVISSDLRYHFLEKKIIAVFELYEVDRTVLLNSCFFSFSNRKGSIPMDSKRYIVYLPSHNFDDDGSLGVPMGSSSTYKTISRIQRSTGYRPTPSPKTSTRQSTSTRTPSLTPISPPLWPVRRAINSVIQQRQSS